MILFDVSYYSFMFTVMVGLVCWALAPYYVPAANLLAKLSLFFYGFVCMLMSTDKKWSKKDVLAPSQAPTGETKRIIFVRHGESEWNLVFNKGKAKLLPRLLMAWVKEIQMLVSQDSVFFDSPLNLEGIEQAKELSEFFVKNQDSTDPDISAMLDPSSSVLCSSTLRRAIGTLVAALWEPRLKQGNEKVLLLSAGQEISRNVDAISLADDKGIPDLHSFEKQLSGFNALERIDSSYNDGNKPVFGNGLTRLQAFSDWAMQRPEKTIIIGGHSLWFRFFFQTYLPEGVKGVALEARTHKVHNTGVVAFDLTGAGKHYKIVPDSVKVVYKGFDNKKKKSV